MSRPRTLLLAAAFGSLLAGCGVAPPASQFPNGQAALDRMKASYDCAWSLQANAKLDHKSDQGRLRGNLLFFAAEPASVRFDVVSPFGVSLATLTSDGRRFAFNDLAQKRFLEGPASACNLARLTQVPVPPHALVSLLTGRAPLLVHQPEQATVRWSTSGFYEVEIPSTRGATQRLRLVPPPEDFAKPWAEQRLRVLDVRVTQASVDLFHAELSDHASVKMGEPQIDEDNLEPPIPPSGPMCQIEVPRRIHVEVGPTDDDVIFRYEDKEHPVTVNPPLPQGTFLQPVPGGVQRIPVGECDR